MKEISGSTIKWVPFFITVAFGIIIWFIPAPTGVKESAWHLFAVFVATIVGFISKPLPMGAISIIAMTVIAVTNTLTIEETLSGFGNSTIWLIVIAFFISRGFIKTGLGERIAYVFVRLFGKKTLSLSYSLLISDLILAPAIPSNTARAGGVIFPIIQSLSRTFGSKPEDGTERKMGAFLLTVGFQGNLITSAMFMTAMAANPLIVKLASDTAGVTITWFGWATAMIVPGLVALIVVPFIIYKIFPPEIKQTPEASRIAKEKLDEFGQLKSSEKRMIAVFIVVLGLWIGGDSLGIGATTAALIGLSLLLLLEVLTWSDIKNEQGAWDTLVWFATLFMMATYMNKLGLIPWFSKEVSLFVSGYNWMFAVLILALVYFYSHYFFASSTAHISAMYAAFLSVMLQAGAPAMLAVILLAAFSNLFGATTHYGSGPAPVFFGAGYIEQKKWWTVGFIVSTITILIFVIIGGLWWKLLGYW
ncbi:anion permease [Psychrobacillus vulpis]|uniref:Anion permease n=1 Tax=Psychrobacillus vulpis TaxID=2325572 RepID=A0A544TDY6_9BACI|nr:anion permease [Psychrobacillus vulpis]TQR15682.1 anion permease [Psychrobacillus vulpis]